MWERRYEVPEISIKLKNLFLKEIERREPSDRIWLTDTVYCGRKKLLQMKGFEPRYTEESITRIWLGIVVGSTLESMGIAREVTVEYRGCRGRVDCVMDTGEPMEIKVTTSLYITASEYAETHVHQLSRYCLAMGKPTGILFYYVPNVKLSSLPAYRYEFDLNKVRSVTDARLDVLDKALRHGDPFMVPPTWHSPTMNNWECRKCTYQAICRNEGGL
ncbi:MAG: hypothetical protein RMI45_08395 [Ignisphaera sp.]|nr:hypothetical protein [Ignisphaera sp.]